VCFDSILDYIGESAKKRDHIAQEMLDSEKSYSRYLEMMVEVII